MRGMLLIGTWWRSRDSFFVNGKEMVDLLRIIGVVGREREASFDLEEGFKEFEGGELPIEVVERVLEEDNKSVLGSWMKGNFVKLCRCLGILTKGFEEEILMLLRRMEEQKKFKDVVAGKKKKKFQKVYRSERELKKLECSVN